MDMKRKRMRKRVSWGVHITRVDYVKFPFKYHEDFYEHPKREQRNIICFFGVKRAIKGKATIDLDGIRSQVLGTTPQVLPTKLVGIHIEEDYLQTDGVLNTVG